MIVLDTNVVSELMRRTPSPAVLQWARSYPKAELFTTAITEAEIFLGIELLSAGKRRAGLQEFAETIFGHDFDGRIIAFDSRAARAFARIAARRRALGKPISQADAQIAAITLVFGATLATRDIADFEDCEIRLTNPWAG